jgi:hypothetical protein
MLPSNRSSKPSTELVEIQRTGEVLTFNLNNPDRGNEVTGCLGVREHRENFLRSVLARDSNTEGIAHGKNMENGLTK